MKKHIIIVTVCIVGTLGIVGAGVFANARLDPTSAYVALKKEELKENENPAVKIKNNKVAYVGSNIDINLGDLRESETFYLAKGEDEIKAKEDALLFQKEYSALFAKAKEKGYSATNQEIDDAVEEIKELSKTPENKDVVGPIISAYPNEEAYWKYLKHVYKKQLVVQKYVADLEKSFADGYSGEKGTEEYNKAWRQWFDSFKKQAIQEEGFKAAKGVTWIK